MLSRFEFPHTSSSLQAHSEAVSDFSKISSNGPSKPLIHDGLKTMDSAALLKMFNSFDLEDESDCFEEGCLKSDKGKGHCYTSNYGRVENRDQGCYSRHQPISQWKFEDHRSQVPIIERPRAYTNRLAGHNPFPDYQHLNIYPLPLGRPPSMECYKYIPQSLGDPISSFHPGMSPSLDVSSSVNYQGLPSSPHLYCYPYNTPVVDNHNNLPYNQISQVNTAWPRQNYYHHYTCSSPTVQNLTYETPPYLSYSPAEIHRRPSSRRQVKSPNERSYSSDSQMFDYRSILDRDSDGNWNVIVARIVEAGEQQASIFLQQKLKVANPKVKQRIFDAITEKAYLLMINRFGNFLIQRAFENGTPDQILKITSKILGNVSKLATDPYGCHVIQKALDYSSLSIKKLIIEEMLENIKFAVTQKYTCHVWQKLIEINWNEKSEGLLDIMPTVNRELRGHWVEVSLNASGSLVVQTLIENCNTNNDGKMECVQELLDNLDRLVCDQWGNWVVQHLLDYGRTEHKNKVIDHVVEHSAEYSVDQYGSSVIEKMFKTCDESVMQRYLDTVCSKSSHKVKIGLVDIAANVYGCFLVQYILRKGLPGDKQKILRNLKRHMVYLRSTKWGTQCVWLINNLRD